MKKHITTILVILVVIAAVVLRFFATKNAEKETAEANRLASIPGVELMYPVMTETSSEISAPGRIVAVKSADVIARVSGMILKQNYKEGDYVKEGQLLYTIDPEEFQISYQRAKANLESAKATQYQAQKDFERAAELVKNDFVSKSSYDQALATRDAANASVRANIAAVNDAKRLLSYTKVTAPVSGKISRTIVTAGNYLSSPNTVLTKVVSVDPIYVQYSLDSRLYSQLKNDEILPGAGQKSPIKVEVTLPDGTVYDKIGNADFSDNTISETTGSITLRATFPNPDGVLIPGDFINVKVYSNKIINQLSVPQAAVRQDTDGRYLFVVDENNIAHKRKIETNGQKGDNWIILSGISENEKFVSNGVIAVRDGAVVNVIKDAEQITAKADVQSPKTDEEDAEAKISDTNNAEDETEVKEN